MWWSADNKIQTGDLGIFIFCTILADDNKPFSNTLLITGNKLIGLTRFFKCLPGFWERYDLGNIPLIQGIELYNIVK